MKEKFPIPLGQILSLLKKGLYQNLRERNHPRKRFSFAGHDPLEQSIKSDSVNFGFFDEVNEWTRIKSKSADTNESLLDLQGTGAPTRS